jgi:uncharacterized protein (DUF2141 family)
MRKIMNEITNRKSMLARFVALFTVLVFMNFPTMTFAQSSCPGIHVKILDIRNNTGAVVCALFKTSEGFPSEFMHSATNIIMTKIQDTQARCDFVDIPTGTYALAVIHDENMDGKLGTNLLGVPTEGYGFSSEAQASLSAPSFEAARISHDGRNLDLTISLNY